MSEIDNKEEIVVKKEKKDMSWSSFFILLAIILSLRFFVLEPHTVSGSSMDNTFKNGDYVLVDKISYRFKKPSKGDVVVFIPPKEANNTSRFIKRIISSPGESIEVKDSKTYINENQISEDFVEYVSDKDSEKIVLGNEEYYVMGDNRSVSYDSRYWGPVKKENIEGRVLLRLYPFNKINLFPGIKEYQNTK